MKLFSERALKKFLEIKRFLKRGLSFDFNPLITDFNHSIE